MAGHKKTDKRIYNRIWQPQCFDVDDWNSWREAESIVPRKKDSKQPVVSICIDCTGGYQALMIEEERCGNPTNKRR
jgi:hypothetical protein